MEGRFGLVPTRCPQEEIIEFASRWDPSPQHVDPHAALRTPFQGLAASGAHTISIDYRLLYSLSQLEQEPRAGVAALGFEVRLPRPVRAGDRLTLIMQPTGKRDSEKSPKAGVALTEGALTNQASEVVLEIVTTGLFAKRPL